MIVDFERRSSHLSDMLPIPLLHNFDYTSDHAPIVLSSQSRGIGIHTRALWGGPARGPISFGCSVKLSISFIILHAVEQVFRYLGQVSIYHIGF